MAPEYLRNELLTYAFDSYNRDNIDDIELAINNFYEDKSVRTAKQLLWDKYTEKLPAWKDRRNTKDSGAKERDVSDIMQAIRTLDEKYSDDDEMPFVFAAVKIRNLPDKRAPNELSVHNRVCVLELQVSELMAAKHTYAATATAGGIPPPLNLGTRRSERNIPVDLFHV